MAAGAPGEVPPGSKSKKVRDWLFQINKEAPEEALQILGRLLEDLFDRNIEAPWGEPNAAWVEDRERVSKQMAAHGLSYVAGGRILNSGSIAPTKSLQEAIKSFDVVSVVAEIDRAAEYVESKPREAISAAYNVLEAICKEYILARSLEMSKKLDLRNVWAVVRKDLGLDPSALPDDGLREIVSGMISVVNGLCALRTHNSSAHALMPGKKGYNIKPRHARLAVNASHTLAAFLMETWRETRSGTDASLSS